MSICKHPGCSQSAVARGYCMRHYKQARASTLRVTPAVGSIDGYGLYGVLDEDEEGLLCHECGGRYRSLGSHVAIGHGMSATDYKDRHGLPRGTALITRALRETHSQHARDRLDGEGWRALEDARDPTMASHSRDRGAFMTAGVLGKAGTARENLKKSPGRVAVPRTCAVCGTAFTGRKGSVYCSDLCSRIGKYEKSAADWAPVAWAAHERGESDLQIAKAMGLISQQVKNAIAARRRWLDNRAVLAQRLDMQKTPPP